MNKKKKPLAKFSKRRYDKECMKLAKEIVRLRDMNVCQKCGKQGPGLHCSHVISDGKDTRLSVDPRNMKLLCYACHIHRFHKNPLIATEWFKNKFPERYDYLIKEHSKPKLGSIELERWEMRYTELKEELENMKEIMSSFGFN